MHSAYVIIFNSAHDWMMIPFFSRGKSGVLLVSVCGYVRQVEFIWQMIRRKKMLVRIIVLFRLPWKLEREVFPQNFSTSSCWCLIHLFNTSSPIILLCIFSNKKKIIKNNFIVRKFQFQYQSTVVFHIFLFFFAWNGPSKAQNSRFCNNKKSGKKSRQLLHVQRSFSSPQFL